MSKEIEQMLLKVFKCLLNRLNFKLKNIKQYIHGLKEIMSYTQQKSPASIEEVLPIGLQDLEQLRLIEGDSAPTGVDFRSVL